MRAVSAPLFLALAVCALGDQSKELKTYVVSLAPKLTAAYKSKDSGFFEKLYPASFHSEDPRGVTQGKKASLFLIRFRFNSMIKVLDFHEQLTAVKAAEGKGSVTSTCVLTGLLKTRGSATPQSVRIVRYLKDDYVKQGHDWMQISEQDLREPLVKVNGQTPVGFATMAPARRVSH